MQYGQFAGTGRLPEKTSEREDFCYAAYNCKRNIQKPGNIPGQRDYCRGMGTKRTWLQNIWIYRSAWRNIFWDLTGGIPRFYGELCRDFQTECRCGHHCKRNTGSNTTGKTAVWDPGNWDQRRGSFSTGLSAAEKTPQHGISAYGFTPASENQYVSGSIPCAFSDCLCHSQVLPGERICLCAYTTDHRKWLRRCRRDVPGNNHGSEQHSEDGRRKSRFFQRLLQ